MHRYRRAYTDSNSPLTPLKPLNSDAFNFNIDGGVASSTLAVSGNGNYSGRPRSARQSSYTTWGNNTSGRSWPTTPKSCDSALQKCASLVKYVAGLGSENIGVPIQFVRNRRAIKHEPLDNVPTITLESPPRTKRRRSSIAQSENGIKGEAFPTYGYTLGTGQLTSSSASTSSSRSFSSSSTLTSTSATSFSSSLSSTQQEEFDGQYLTPTSGSFDRSNIRRSSPVMPKPLSPRFGEFLKRWGINCCKSIFERQEIDLQTFCCLTPDDLELLGIQDPDSRERVITAINFLSSVGSKWVFRGCEERR